jgi:hypothetical protein
VGWLKPIIAATQEAKHRRITFHLPQAEIKKDPITGNKLVMVVCACNPSYVRGIHRSIIVQS